MTPLSLVHDGSGFRPWKTGEATSMGVIVAETFAQEVLQHIGRPRHQGTTKLPLLSSLP